MLSLHRFLSLQARTLDTPGVSPDGKVAYCSDESGTDEIYVSSFPNVPGKLQVSVAGGSVPCWRSDGKELYYVTPDNKLMAAEMKAHCRWWPRKLFFGQLDLTAAGLESGAG
jgi:Tol biopolymer transport system component